MNFDFDDEIKALIDEVKAGPKYPTLPDEFWEARSELRHIRYAAHSRAVSADSTLGCIAARAMALVHPTIQLPPIVGAPGSLNTMVAIAGKPGAGKSSSMATAAELLPIPSPPKPDTPEAVSGGVRADLPSGSGEGLAELYYALVRDDPTKAAGKNNPRQKQRWYDGVLLMIDEGETFNQTRQRQGQTLGGTLRAAWTGGTIGQSNATSETNRPVMAHSYRLCVVIGFQPDNAVQVFDEVSLGTPQRFLWCSAIDGKADEEAEWPGELHVTPPHIIRPRRFVSYPADVAAQVRAEKQAVTRGEVVLDELDAHRTLMRLKLATTLCVLRGGDDLRVNHEDWELAGMWLDTSDGVRNTLLKIGEDAKRGEYDKRLKAIKAEARAVHEVADERAAERVRVGAKLLASKVREGKVTTARQGQQELRRYRDLYDEVLDLAIKMAWVVEAVEPGQGQDRRKLQPGVEPS